MSRETGRDGFQSKVKKRILREFPECETHRLDANDTQGIPDLLILCPNTWSTLEVKKEKKAKKQPNQEYYVNKHNTMSYSSFIFPENEDDVFNELHKHHHSNSKGEQNDI